MPRSRPHAPTFPLGPSVRRSPSPGPSTPPKRTLLPPPLPHPPPSAELKTPRSSLTKAQAVPLGFDGFLALPQSGKGYSGVGTWTRQAVVVAQAAEEGLLGDLLLSRAPAAAATAGAVAIGEADDRPQRIGCYPSLDELDLLNSPPTTGDDVGSHSSSSIGGGGGGGGGPFDLGSIDLEGRAILVDLGLFILINVYCPNETSPQRLPFKVNFLRVLEARVRALRSAGREVVVVGDVNVVARPEDHGEGSLASKQETFWNHPVRSAFFRDGTDPPPPLSLSLSLSVV